MKNSFKGLLLALLVIAQYWVKAQDVNATIQVIGPSLQTTDKQILTNLQTSMQQFINGTKWTNEVILPHERLDVSIFFEIKSISNVTDFSGTMQIQVSRPVLFSTYKTSIFNFSDDEIGFRYGDMENLTYQEGQNISDLTTLLAYYINIAIGYDEDSYSKMGGDDFFKKSQSIVNIMQGKYGWGQNDGRGGRNKYYLADNLNNARYKAIRELTYNYHRNGLDQMFENPITGRNNITEAIKGIEELNKLVPNNVLQKTFFSAKWGELIEIYKASGKTEQKEIVTLLSKLDPSNGNRYEQIKS
jgi:hypothetical protein